MNSLLKHWKLILIGLLLIIGYGFTRLINLDILPIFTDEAIYIRWSQIGGNDASWRFISLTDGKQPLYTWFTMVSLRIFSDPLIAGRMVSVGAGFATLIGLIFLTRLLFKSQRITVITSILYIISPFTLMYDRLALYDSLSTTFSVWSLYFAIRLVREVKLDIALLLGMVLGFGMINKTSGFLSLYLLPLTLILFNWKDSQRIRKLTKWTGYVIIAAIVSQVIYGVLRLSPYFHMIAQKDSVFVYPLSQIFYTWRFFKGNMSGILDWFINYLTLPIVLSMIPVLFLRKLDWRTKVLILGWCILPMIALAYFGKVLYPRYILFMVVPLLMFSAYFIDFVLSFWKLQIRNIILLSLLLFPPVRASYYILFQPIYAPIPYADRGQLIDDWPSGYGIKEVNKFLKTELEKGPIAVFTDGTFGLLPASIEIYNGSNPNLFIKGLWPFPENITSDMLEQVIQKPTFLVMNLERLNKENWNVEEVATFRKVTNGGSSIRLYKLLGPKHLE